MNASPVFRMWGGEAHLAANLHFEGIHIGFRDQNPLLCLSASRHLSCQHFRAVHLHACTHAPVSARVCACMHVRVRMHVCVCACACRVQARMPSANWAGRLWSQTPTPPRTLGNGAGACAIGVAGARASGCVSNDAVSLALCSACHANTRAGAAGTAGERTRGGRRED